MGLWAFLRSLWPWRTRRRPPPVTPAATRSEPALSAPEAVVAPTPAAQEPAPEPAIPPAAPPLVAELIDAEPTAETPSEAPAAEHARVEELAGEAAPDVYAWTEAEDADEDEGWEDEDGDLEGPDPFISGERAQDEPVDLDLEARRAAARAEALEGEQRIYLHTPAGPGSLAEALNQLLAEGLVQADFIDDAEGEPHILYRPVDRKAAIPG